MAIQFKKKTRQMQKRVLDTHNVYTSTAVLQPSYTYIAYLFMYK